MPQYKAPQIQDLGSLADLTLGGSIGKTGGGSDMYTAQSGLTGSNVSITVTPS